MKDAKSEKEQLGPSRRHAWDQGEGDRGRGSRGAGLARGGASRGGAGPHERKNGGRSGRLLRALRGFLFLSNQKGNPSTAEQGPVEGVGRHLQPGRQGDAGAGGVCDVLSASGAED